MRIGLLCAYFSLTGFSGLQEQPTPVKLLQIRTAGTLYLDKAFDAPIPVVLPPGMRLIETARVDTYWVKVEATDTLRTLIANAVDAETVRAYLASDWYFYDGGSFPDGFAADPVYLLENWIDHATVQEESVVLFTKRTTDPSLWRRFQADLSENRIQLAFQVWQGNQTLAAAVRPQFRNGDLVVPIPDLAAS